MTIKWEKGAGVHHECAEAAQRYAQEALRVGKQSARRREVQEIPMRFAELCRRRLEALHEHGFLLADAGEAFWFSQGVDIRLKYGNDFVHVPALRFRAPELAWDESLLVVMRWAAHRAARALLGERIYFEKLWIPVSKAVARQESKMSERYGRLVPGLVSFDEALQIKAASGPEKESRRVSVRI